MVFAHIASHISLFIFERGAPVQKMKTLYKNVQKPLKCHYTFWFILHAW